jgi:hypothetical protein
MMKLPRDYDAWKTRSDLDDRAADNHEPPCFTCPRCGWTTFNPNDRINRYCGHCHVFVDDIEDDEP